ncbi:RNA polymerase sigma factor [Aliikangiella maris]|uniref:DUF6596 domain-containing protein n=2 Tax=Aliikangiella maris TaxID=3162458 RepID=A0ABV3MRV7_9GAMM
MNRVNAHIQAAYPQALARLMTHLKTIDCAEEYLQVAVEKALFNWPKNLPDSPAAWLIRVALNKYIDHYRIEQKKVSLEALPEPTLLPDLNEQALLLSYNDDLLRLIFTCCHPALNQQTQIILALKHVLGLSITQIASALVINETTLEQRLLRAKKKISSNQIPYQTPSCKDWPTRLASVLKTIYLLFNEGYFPSDNQISIHDERCKEAIRLARLLDQCIKNDAEVKGLLALLLQQDARSPARISAQGNFVLLDQQNRHLWKQKNIQEGNILAEKAIKMGKGTPYALQAAIASLHNNAVSSEQTDWLQIYQLYQLLIQQDPNPVIQLNAAIALAKSGHPQTAIEQVKQLAEQLDGYRHYYTSLAGLYFDNGQFQLALEHYQIAQTRQRRHIEKSFIINRILQCQQQLF